MHVCDVRYSLGKKQILETRCVKQHACLVDPLRDLHGFSNAHTLMFCDPKKGRLKPRKGLEIKVPRRSRVEISISRTPQRAHSDRKESQKGGQVFFKKNLSSETTSAVGQSVSISQVRCTRFGVQEAVLNFRCDFRVECVEKERDDGLERVGGEEWRHHVRGHARLGRCSRNPRVVAHHAKVLIR